MKILVVDDEPLVRRTFLRAFSGKGFQVSEASDGVSGLKMWQELEPDLVILDLLMPGMTGQQVLQQISHDIRKKTKVVLMSAFSGTETSLLQGADLFISKPFDDISRTVKILTELVEK